MAQILRDPGAGGFTVTVVLDRRYQEIKYEIGEFLTGRGRRDTILLYLSGHGVLSRSGELYFATRDTRLDRLGYDAIPADWLRDRLNECDATQQTVILDCCHGGSFPGAKAGTDLEMVRRLSGRGREVLTSSRGSEYSYEDARERRGRRRSLFTAALVDGIRTGAADRDNDGLITAEDAFDHAAEVLKAAGAAQNPQYSRERGEGKVVLARNPLGVHATQARLPADLRSALGSGYPQIRAGAVRVLGSMLASDDPEEVFVATVRLKEVATDDNDAEIIEAARKFLRTSPERKGIGPPRVGRDGAIYGVGLDVLVSDLDRSIEFYRDKLGFLQIDRGAASAVLVSGDTRLVLREVPPGTLRDTRLIYLNLEVGDVDNVHRELTSQGVRFIHPPHPVNRGDRLELWSAAFSDPDGHNIAITQWRAID